MYGRLYKSVGQGVAKIAGGPKVQACHYADCSNLRILSSLHVRKRHLAQRQPMKRGILRNLAATWTNDLWLSLQHMQGR